MCMRLTMHQRLGFMICIRVCIMLQTPQHHLSGIMHVTAQYHTAKSRRRLTGAGTTGVVSVSCSAEQSCYSRQRRMCCECGCEADLEERHHHCVPAFANSYEAAHTCTPMLACTWRLLPSTGLWALGCAWTKHFCICKDRICATEQKRNVTEQDRLK